MTMSYPKEFSLYVEANVKGEDVIDALEKIAEYFQVRADSLQFGDVRPLPQIFEPGGLIRLIPVLAEEVEDADTLAGDGSAV